MLGIITQTIHLDHGKFYNEGPGCKFTPSFFKPRSKDWKILFLLRKWSSLTRVKSEFKTDIL
jgi:hypothetical protein